MAEQIKTAVAEAGLDEEIPEVLVPTEEVIEVRRGKKVTSERRFMPGYVLVHMEMTSKGYHLISQINRVTGFLGPQGKPMPMRDAEVNQILNRVEEGEAAPRNLIRFDIGERVKVTFTKSDNGDKEIRKAKLGGLDILVPCVGISAFHPLEGHDDSYFDSVMAVNVTAVFRLIRDAVPALKQSRHGRIVTIGSTMAAVKGTVT